MVAPGDNGLRTRVEGHLRFFENTGACKQGEGKIEGGNGGLQSEQARHLNPDDLGDDRAIGRFVTQIRPAQVDKKIQGSCGAEGQERE